MTGSISALDVALFVLYFVLTLIVGLRSIPLARTSEDYFVAGRSMGCCSIGISVSSALFSGITFLGAPGYTFQHGMSMSFQLVGYFLAIPVFAKYIVPIYVNMKLTSAFEILEVTHNHRNPEHYQRGSSCLSLPW